MKQIIILLNTLILAYSLSAQSSFQTTHFLDSMPFGNPTLTYFQNDYLSYDNNELLTLGHFLSSNEEHIFTFDLNGNFKAGYKVHLDELENTWTIRSTSTNDSLIAYIAERFDKDALLVLNRNTGEVWSKNTLLDGASFLAGAKRNTGISNGNIIVNSTTPISGVGGMSSSLALHCFNASGSPLWSYTYALGEFFVFRDLKILANGNILILGTFEIPDKAILFEISPTGEPLNTTTIDSIRPREITIAASGNVFLIGTKIRDNVPLNSSWDRNGAIIKLNANYQVQWAKEVILQELNSARLSLHEKQNGNLIISYSGIAKLPISVFEINEVNNLLWQKGHPFANSNILVLPDNSVVFFAGFGYDQNNEFDNRFILARTNADASFDDCPTYTVCVDINDFEVEESSTAFAYAPMETLAPFNISVEPITWEFEDYCNTPPAPTPNFLYPDTICLDACTTPDSLQNYFAHHQEWTITAPDGTDTLITEKTPEYCFEQEGTYLVEQLIWFLGCDYSYEQTVEVVPAMDINLGEDGINCNALPYELALQSNRPIMSYEWSNGSTAPSLTLTESGTYWVAARGPYCEAVERDTIDIGFIEDYVDLPPFSLPNDTSICVQHYPYIVTPMSNYALDYSLNGEQALASSHAITQAGTYTFATTIEGCIFEDSIYITTNDCQANIYLPNVFSPNLDGINDTWAAQGLDFETISIEVYDRWGNLLAYPQGKTAAWDGQDAANGVYIIQLTYRNLLSGQVEVVAKDVMLMK